MVNRANRSCGYFPCHKGMEDCTFCYCPFYPCLDEKRGRHVYSAKLNKNIWSCQGCGWIHKTRVVDEIFSLIRKDRFYPKTGLPKVKSGKMGVVILGHGSRLKTANKTILDIAGAVRRQGWDIVEPAYLQFQRPGLAASIKRAVENGCRRVIIVPFFLFMGNHVTRDIPKAIKQEKRKYPGVDFVYAKNMGEDARIERIVLDRIEETLF